MQPGPPASIGRSAQGAGCGGRDIFAVPSAARAWLTELEGTVLDGALLAVSTVLQLAAALMALRLVVITKHRVAWLCIAGAILLMTFRRAITLYRVFSGDGSQPADLTAELVALVISVLMVLGVARIGPMFSELKRSEAKLRTSQRQLQDILDHTTAAVYVKDLEGRVLLANNTVQRLLGFEGKDIRGKTDFDFFPPEVAQQMRDNDLLVQREGKSLELDETVLHADGSEHRYISVKFPLLDTQGEVYGVCGISTDITERMRVADEQRQFEAKLQAAQKLESLGVLARGIAHDFNNLLVGIMGSADLALNTKNLEPELREDLDDILSAAEAAAGLCRQLLAYSGRGQLQLEPVDTSALVQRITRLIDVSTKNARLNCDFAAELPVIEADATQVTQVLMNLLTNASEAIEGPSGNIWLRTRSLSLDGGRLEHQVVGNELEAGSYICIEVEDDGVGMDQETQERLFEPFYTTRFTGRGLGLAAVAGIIRGHKGAMTLQSTLGEGTCFRAYFPIPKQRLQVHATSAANADEFASGRKVLVVDDEAFVRKVAQRVLKRAGFEVLLAEDGATAVELFRQHASAIQLVLLDLTMPDMDGEQTFKALRAIDPQVNVVLSSGYDEASTTRRGFASETSGFSGKTLHGQAARGLRAGSG